MDNKQEFDARQNALAAIQARLPEMALSEAEREILDNLLTAQQERELKAWRHSRAEEAVSLLFPVWRGGSIEPPTHPRWHEKSWWWNGASIKSLEECVNGDIQLKLSSYTGGGETDTINRFVLKREWLEAADMPSVIQAFMAGEVARMEAQRTAHDLARAQADMAAAHARLAKLNGAA